MTSPLALYIHWPFCVSKCPYCDFNSHVRANMDDDAMGEALLADMAHEAALLAGRELGSIFFGGGTPSLMPPTLVERLIDQATTHWTPADDIEITLEANPSSVEAARFADLAAAGVSRVSLGLQSFEDDALRFLGRAHGAAEGLAALDMAQAHFGRVSFDLIYALPGQTLQAWEAQLARALSLGTGHLSLYQLTIEPGTRFATDVRRGAFEPMDDDVAADFYALTQERTAAAGLPAYETSNHARAGQESRHNLTYWRYHDYAGIGPGAHGRRRNLATERHRKPENFLGAVARNGHGLRSETALSRGEQAVEALLMGLRLTEGVRLDVMASRFGFSEDALIDAQAVDRLAGHGLLLHEESHLALTEAGRPLLDAILAEVVAVEAEAAPA